MVLNAAVQTLREADELKQKILKFKSGTSMLQDRNLWSLQQQLQNVYQKVLVMDLDYALDKKVEQDLWNIGFKQQIDALQAITKDRKNPLRSEGQAMLSWVLQAAAGFYLCMLHQICTVFKLDLPFRRRASLLGCVEGWGGDSQTEGAAETGARYICQHCLVHLGDLARYRRLPQRARSLYRQALVVSVHSGQPYNQLALVSWRRGSRLSAVYWHVRSLLVRSPFPPAPANLSTTLAQAASEDKPLPVLEGVCEVETEIAPPGGAPVRLDARAHLDQLLAAAHTIHAHHRIESVPNKVDALNSALIALVATDCFETMTLIKMACVLIWLVHSTTDNLTLEADSVTETEAVASAGAAALAAGALLALLLPAYAAPVAEKLLPPVKVWIQWIVLHPQILRSPEWQARMQLWPALAHLFNLLTAVEAAPLLPDTFPLPEDEELHGFLPLEDSFKGLKFPKSASWETYGGRIPDIETDLTNEYSAGAATQQQCHRTRVHRLLQLARALVELSNGRLSCTSEEEGGLRFSAHTAGGPQLSAAVAAMVAAVGAAEGRGGEPAEEEDEPIPPPPRVISEADFRETVRERRAGILKPQGSLERAREERAQAGGAPDVEEEAADDSKDDKKESRRARVNIAMAAILRKQEETTNKQVKFISPPPTPDSTADNSDTSSTKEEKPKMIQPKVMKSLANLPIGKKTGGILSLKDKSAGYPHLVNIEPEPKKPEKEEKKEPKVTQNLSQNSQQNYQPKRQEQPQQNWPPSVQNPNSFNEATRMNFQKTYGIQNAGISYNPNYPQPQNMNNNIRLPVVNPKEIDVRSAALHKQNSRQELFQDPKFGHNYQVSGDKKNFLNDLPPRFANQYRYWQSPQDNQYSDNKFRDDRFKANNQSLFNNQQAHPNWPNTPQMPENYQQQPQWWKSENPSQNFNANFAQPMNMQPNFYSPLVSSNMPNPYQNMSSYQIQNTNMGQQKADNVINPPNYLQNQPHLQSIQNLIASPNFNSSINSFGTYTPAVSYDSTMYPQFGASKVGFPPQMNIGEKPPGVSFQGNKDILDIGRLNISEMPQRTMNVNFNEPMNRDVANTMDLNTEEGGSYSLFSGAPPEPWGRAPPQQSLWSGPGPSPLERLLEQQKQMKQPSPPQ